MLFPRTKSWHCQLQRNHIQLYQGERLQDQQCWQPGHPLGEQLESLLSPLSHRLPWRHGIRFELGAPHVHYLLAPWQDGITTPAELQQYARIQLAKQTEQAANDTRVSFFGHEYGVNAFAAVLDNALFTELKTIARRHRLRFQGCSTPFSRLLNAFGRRLPDDALFACIHEREGYFAARYRGHWHSVFSLNLPLDDDRQHLDIANRLAGLPPLPHYIVHAQQGRCSPIAVKQAPPSVRTI